jgi:hypothetical protein
MVGIRPVLLYTNPMKRQRRGFLKALLAAPVAAATLDAKPEPGRPVCPPFQPHQVWRIKSSKSGRPEMIWLKSYQDQVDFCKAEGLINPNTSVSFNALGEMVVNTKPESGPVFPMHGRGGYVKPPEPVHDDVDRWWED